MSAAESAPDSQLLPVPFKAASPQPSASVQQQFLRLQMVSDMTALLPVPQLTEVLTMPTSQVVPIPHMPPWVMGVYNWRGEILWMVDLGHLCGLSPWYEQPLRRSTHKAVVLRESDDMIAANTNKVKMLGLVVNEVEDIEICDPKSIQAPLSSAVTPELAPLLRGYWWKSNGDMLVFLDGSAIFEAMPKA
ncbi:MAG: chemotaxis protein CheW [Leptolyngbyaceae cyanobacterium MO_188.B28]|nr:chemotaxis protein CheW [Leptolyngbyaceae cyanobacterium MO_188.B28]